MGRKNWKEHVSQKGPGRKTRKQKDPDLPQKLKEQDKAIKKVGTGGLGSRARQRSQKRALKAAAVKALLPEKNESKKQKSSTSPKKKSKVSFKEQVKMSPDENLKINLFHETSDGMSDALYEMSDSSNGEKAHI